MIIYISKHHVLYKKQVYTRSIPEIRIVYKELKLRDRSIVTFLIVKIKL